MTGAELIAKAREQTLLDTDDVSDAVVLGHINRAIAIVGGRFEWPFLAQTDTITLADGTQGYAWPTDWVKIDSLTIVDKRIRLKRLSAKEAEDRYGNDFPSGEPRSFFLWGNQINFVPIPNAVGTISARGYTQPTILAATSNSPGWNDQYHEFLADYAIQKLWEREEDQAMAEAARQEFENGIGELASFYNDQAADERMVWGEQPDKYVGSGASNMPWLDGV